MKHTSKKYTLIELEQAVASSFSIRQVLNKLGLAISGGNHSHLKEKIRAFGFNAEHFLGQAARRKLDKTWSPPTKRELKDILEKGTIYNSHRLKQRLIKSKILIEECAKCKLEPIWNDAVLSLHLDHKNGDKTDNRLKNLQLLCPNCHSQTPTYAGKNKRLTAFVVKYKLDKKCSDCHTKIGRKSKTGRCVKCSQKHQQRVKRPPLKALERMIKEKSWTALGKEFGVSDNAVRKWARTYGII